MSTPYTSPANVEQGTAEDIAWGIDCTKQLTDSQTPTAVSVTLNQNGTPVDLTDSPTVVGNVVIQRIRPGTLTTQPGAYELVTFFTPSGTTNVLELILNLVCNF